MTSRLRGSAREEPKATSLLSAKSRTYLSSSREPRDSKSMFEGSRNKVSRTDSRGKYESFPERSDGKHDTNGYRSSQRDVEEEEEDPDLLYRRSRDHFGSWNIQDIIGEKDHATNAEEKRSKSDRKSRFDLFKSNGTEKKKIANGNTRSKHKSPDGLGSDFHDKRFQSNDSKHSKSRSPDHDRDKYKLNKKNARDKTRSKSPVKDADGTINLQHYEDEDYRPKKNRALLQEIENFGPNRRGFTGSPERSERRYSGYISPERDNDKIRLLIDRFKSGDQSNDPEDSPPRKPGQSHKSPIRENDKYRVKIRPGDGFGSIDRKNSSKEKSEDRRSGGKYPSLDRKVEKQRRHEIDEGERRVGSTNRKWKDNHDDIGRSESAERRVDRNGESEIQSYKSLERKQRANGNPRESNEALGFRKRSDTYSVERTTGRQKPRDPEDDPKETWSKRRSYVYSGSPEEFDVQIQKYERALTSPRKDPELSRKSEVKRRSSLKIKDEQNEAQDRNGRHNRPLTPPEENHRKFEDRRTSFNAKDWYDSNKQFAAKYLNENSKIRFGAEERNDVDDELGKDQTRHGSPIREQKETYFGDRRSSTDDQAFHQKHTSSLRMEGGDEMNERDTDFRQNRKSTRNLMPVERTNGRTEPVTIKIRNVFEDHFENEKRTKRGFLAKSEETNGRNRTIYDDDSPKRNPRGTRDKDWTSATTPARKIWNYRDGGAQITDVDEGQPCLKCGDACSGFLQHPWRKNCTSCKCPREAHDVCHEEWVSVRSRLGLKGDGASGSVACDPREMGLAWAPPGLPSHKVEEYFSMLPEISVPRLGTPGERYRDRQLAMQLPKQDLAKTYCRHLATEHYTSADDFMAARNEIALDIGTVQEVLETGANCAGCNESLKYGSLVVSAGKLGELYHPGCFQCVQCRELLVDLAYCVYNDKVYCERHYAERLKGRCAACDELIFSGEFTRAMNKDWHSGHFCCWQCDESLTGQRYVLRDEHPYCIKCYESVFANGCEECSKIIGIDSKDLSYKDKHWHEACFLCNKCRVSLVDKQFGSKVDKIYCGNCYDAQFASRCDGCGEIFRAGTKKMEYKTRQWHEKCFCCVVCKNAIGTKSFIPREQEIYCAGCYEDKFATRCVKCNKIITSGGVTYKNEPWHRECFTCSNCSTSLAGQRFTSRDEKPYCADCFGELFAKRCTACTKPITGIGGTRFISFEDRHWHNDCFICAGCKTSLVGRGFITDADDIICPECAKQKLM